MGRRSKYKESIAARICEMIRADSYTVVEICRNAGINIDTYYEWKKKYPEFSESIKKAEDDRDLKFVVAARKSLLKKITGDTFNEERVVYVLDKDGEKVEKERVETTKYLPPDTAAIIFTLCNKDGWTNRYSAEVTGKDGENLFQGVVIQKTYEPDDEKGG